jgi:membrane-associated phospholipid phosphatase
VAAVYFAYLAGVSIARLKPKPALLAIATLLSILIAGMPGVTPLAYLLVGYWLPALIVRAPNLRFEQRLLDLDRRFFGPAGLARFERSAPRLVIEYLELAYLLCYAVVPAGYAWILLGGNGADAVDRFWSVVLLASFLCYGLLPWIPTRAPRAVEPRADVGHSPMRSLNLAVLNRASVQWNTFPSGHTAASVATALAVAGCAPLAGVIFGLVALSIAVGSVVGRYHYAADALAGALVALLAFLTVTAVRGL